MLCISRCTDETYAQHFGNGRNKFYLEFRCNRLCSNDNYCTKCSNKSPLNKLQQSRKFNHGAINDPIPDNSHIFGGKWYNDGIIKWGAPPSEIIELAMKYQNEAREGFRTIDIPIEILPLTSVKSNPKVAEAVRRKPKVASELSIAVIDDLVPKKQVRKKPIITPYSTLISTTPQLIHKEVSLSTHIESKMEEIDSNGYTIQYIKLAPFDANGTSYFRDATKNKLYKKVKDKIGVYIGRWNPDTDSIIADIPDSDEE